MAGHNLTLETRDLLRGAVSDAYYEARNAGRTMRDAEFDAVERLAPIVASIDENAHLRGKAEGRLEVLEEVLSVPDTSTYREAMQREVTSLKDRLGLS